MAVANTKSTAVSNMDATPRVISSSFISGGQTQAAVGMVEVAAADDNASVYRMVRIPSSARILRLEVLNDAIAGGTSYDLGLYETAHYLTDAVTAGAAVNDDVFATAIDMTVARSLPLDAMFEVLDIVDVEKRVWELAGLSADPMRQYDICFTADTVGTGAGTLVLRAEWVV